MVDQSAAEAVTARVVHVHDHIEGAVYIGMAVPGAGLKASIFANQYKIGDLMNYGSAGRGPGKVIGREGALFNYTNDFFDGDKQRLFAELPKLRGKPLACWCRHDGVPMTNGITDNGPDNRCHGDLLIHYLNTWTDNQLVKMATGWRTQDDE